MVITRSQSRLPTNAEACQESLPGPATAPPAPTATVPAAANSPSRTHSVSTRTSRSSATVAARKLAAEARHVRELACLEEAALQAQLVTKKLQMEKKAVVLEHQAEVAAIEAEDGSNCSGRSGRSRRRIYDWVIGNERVIEPRTGDEYNNTVPNERPYNQSDVHPSPSLVNILSHTNTVPDPVTQLVSAFDNLVRKLPSNNSRQVQKSNISLPVFDGRAPLDWLVFKRSYADSANIYTPAENLARLSASLKGVAREAVCVLLSTALYPDIVLEELDRRFGRPEQVVLREVAAIRALPRLSNELRDLPAFSSRVRNCVEVVKLLNETDYLYSPELFGALMSELPLLVRTRWMDYAAARVGAGPTSSLGKVELLSRFLAREVDLHAKYDSTFTEPPHAHIPRERAHAVAVESEQVHLVQASSSDSGQSKHNIRQVFCLCCTRSHDVSKCDKFQSMSIRERWQFIKDNKVCYRCLEKRSHNFRLCNKNKNKCTVGDCNRRHHTLLHDPEYLTTTVDNIDERDASPRNNFSVQVSSTATSDALGHNAVRDVVAHTRTAPDASSEFAVPSTRRPLLKLVAVTVSGPAGKVDTYALLDDGSTSTFIDAEISKRIGADGPNAQIHLDCVGGLTREAKVRYVNFEIKGRYADEYFSVRNARSIDGLGLACKQSVTRDDLDKYSYLADISLHLCYNIAKPMLVIGVDNWHLSIATATRSGTKTQPVAIQTALGWVLFGFASSKTRPVEILYHAVDTATKDQELDELIKAQYRLDAIGISKYEVRSTDDQRALSILERTVRRLPEGRFEVGLLWKADHLNVPNSYPLALSRFRSLEVKMLKEPEYAEKYRQNIRDTLSKGYAEECSKTAPAVGVCWYLPHFGVVNPNKPEKLRVVHDAAARTRDVSLNSMLLPGPDFLQSLLGILMRFREGRIAITADIKEMFPQVKISERDRDAQRFLWRDDPSGPIKVYRMSSMIFGACSSPSTAIYIVNHNALEFRNEFPEAVAAIKRDTYMDDFICSIDNVHDAARLASEVVTIHKRGGFDMRGWITNEPAALTQLPAELISNVASSNDIELCRDTITRTLGLLWQPHSDELKFNSGVSADTSPPVTKRQALTQVMRIYDPLGILAPIVVRGRILFQNLWRSGLGWDETLCDSDCNFWRDWFDAIRSISELRVPRRYYKGDAHLLERELHVFCDASESAYVAVAYWRFVDVSGQASVALICSKARVAPLKPASIPRLELQGALIATRLVSSICDAHRIKPSRRYFWCDSMTVLGWLRSDARKYKPFVANRVGEILENSSVSEWRWIPTDLNVVDDATRTKGSVLNVVTLDVWTFISVVL